MLKLEGEYQEEESSITTYPCLIISSKLSPRSRQLIYSTVEDMQMTLEVVPSLFTQEACMLSLFIITFCLDLD